MLGKFGALLLGFAALAGALACKDQREEYPPHECDHTDQCPEGMTCTLAIDHLACTIRCVADDDCPEGQICDWGGASCLTCLDEFDICQPPKPGHTK